jgi:hypothetical protein
MAVKAWITETMRVARWLTQGAFGIGIGIASAGLLPNLSRSQPVGPTVSYVLDAADTASFFDLMQRAEGLATAEITRSFAANPDRLTSAVTIAAERNGTIAPLLSVQVSRADWQTQPIVGVWARYLPVSSILLGFQPVSSGAARSTPPVASPPVPAQPINPNSEPNFYNPLIQQR